MRILQLVAALARQVGRADCLAAVFRLTPTSPASPEAVLTLSLGVHSLAHVYRSRLDSFTNKWNKFRELFGATPAAFAQVERAVSPLGRITSGAGFVRSSSSRACYRQGTSSSTPQMCSLS